MFGINFSTGQNHSYTVRTPITRLQPGDDAQARTSEALDQLVAYPTPGPTSPATVAGTPNKIPMLGTVKSTYHPGSGTVTNEALQGHLLYPGTVGGKIVRDGDVLYAERTGTGTGALARTNEFVAKPFWNFFDRRIANALNPQYVASQRQVSVDTMFHADPSDPEATMQAATRGFNLSSALHKHYIGS